MKRAILAGIVALASFIWASLERPNIGLQPGSMGEASNSSSEWLIGCWKQLDPRLVLGDRPGVESGGLEDRYFTFATGGGGFIAIPAGTMPFSWGLAGRRLDLAFPDGRELGFELPPRIEGGTIVLEAAIGANGAGPLEGPGPELVLWRP